MIGPIDGSNAPGGTQDGVDVLFRLDAVDEATRLAERLGGVLRVRAHAAAGPERVFVDTADARLAAMGIRLALGREGRDSVLTWTSKDAMRRVLRVSGVPAFEADLPPGPFRDALADVVAERRLLPIASVTDVRPPLDVVDREGKVVVRLAFERVRPKDERRPNPPLVLRVSPVRGYRKAFERALDALAKVGAPRALDVDDPVDLLDLDPRVAGRASVRLDASMRTDAAVQQLLLAELAVIESNEPGARRAVDPEFLHEYRVAVRRTRVALSRLRGVFPARTTERFKRELKWLGGVTGAARDLDVYLLELPAYADCLTPEAATHLAPLRPYLESRREAAYGDLDRAMATKRYRRLLCDWRAFLERPVPPRTRLAGATPVGRYANAAIWKAHKKVWKQGAAIDDDTPDEAVHDLRLSCKKLRYLIEFFRSLYPSSPIRAQVKALKRLQEVLGEFNDLSVQQGSLLDTANGMTDAGLAPLETVVALGRLVEVLGTRQRDARDRFASRFTEFTARGNRERARRLFRPAPAGSPTA